MMTEEDMMSTELCVVELPGEGNYAVITPGRVVYGLAASKKELRNLISEEQALISKQSDVPYQDGYIRRPSSIGLIPTFDCNLRCVYCYARGGESKDVMDLAVGRIAINDAVPANNRNYLNTFFVGGGEPLLYIDTVKQLVHHAKTVYDDVGVNVVTNGTFDDNTLRWLLENEANIRVSYDGVMQDVQRPFADGGPSSSIVEKNIQALISMGASVIVQCIITKMGITTMRRSVDLMHSLGVTATKFEPALVTDVSRADGTMEPDPVTYAGALLDVVQYIADKGYDMTVDTGFFAEPSTEFYCGIATSNRVVTPNGNITSCVEVVRPTDPYANRIMIGSINSGRICIDESRRGALHALHYDSQLGGCGKCNLRLICHGGCPMTNIWRGGFPVRKSDFTCSVEHTLLPRLLLMVAVDPRIADIVMEDGTVDRF